MSTVWTITKKEVRSFFDSLMAYILLVVFLALSGFFTWLYGSDIFFIGQATLEPFFSVAYWILFFFIPALTMRMLAEEKRSGTIELLLTKSVTDWQVVSGKFLACFLLIVAALLLTIPYYITVSFLGNIDHGAIWSGYIGTLFISAAYIGIGMFASSVTHNQIIAFLLALFISVFFLIIFDVLAGSFTGALGQLLDYLSLSTHYDSISRGVVDTKDVIYFLAIAFLGLSLAESVLSKRNMVK